MYRRTKVLEAFNKDLISFVEEKEHGLRGAAPHLFGFAFTKQAADYLEQVATLRKAKGKRKRFIRGLLGGKAGKVAREKQTLQLSRDGTLPAAQGNSGVNSREIEMTIKYRAKGSSRHACVQFWK